jgi:hypothetical protein
MKFDIKMQNLAMIYYTEEVDMGYLRYPLGTRELLEKFLTDVDQQ